MKGLSNKPKISKRKVLYITLTTLLPCFTFLVYAPIQLYAANKNEFWFDMSLIVGPIAVCAIAAALILSAVGMMLKKRTHIMWYGAFWLGVGVAMFVQGDYINLNLGVLNGAEIIWSDYRIRFVVNSIVWCAIILASIILAQKMGRKFVKPACIAVALILFLQLVTISVLVISGEKKNSASNYVLTTKNIFTLSEEDNVVVFLLDMFDSRYMNELIAQNDPVLDEFDNFIYYRNHTGSYSTTAYSLGSLFINDYVDNTYPSFEAALSEQYRNTKNLFPVLVEDGCSIDIYCPLTSTIPHELYGANSAVELSKYEINNRLGFAMALYKMGATKFAPDFVKPYVWMDSNAFDRFKSVESENEVYQIDNIGLNKLLQNRQVVKDDQQHFKFIYATGAHYPYVNDENFNPLDNENDYSHEGAMGAAKSALKICSQYIAMMKEADVYDNTTIIIMADHGYYWDGVLTNPLMMVKPQNSQDSFEISDAPTSHVNFQGTVASAMGYEDHEKYGVSIYEVAETDEVERLFYQYNLGEDAVAQKYRLIEYRIAPEGNERKMFSLTGREIEADGTEIDHYENCEFCLENGTEAIDLPNDEGIVHTRKK